MSAINQPVLNIYLGTSACIVGERIADGLRAITQLDGRDKNRISHIFVDTHKSVEGLGMIRVGGEALVKGDSRKIGISPDTIRQNMHAAGEEGRADMFVRGFTPATDDTGAGNIRNNGLAAMCVDDQAQLAALLQKHIGQITAGLGPDASAGPTRYCRVNIVTYLGGGTGSGCLPAMILLVHYALRRLNKGGSIRLFCIIPEPIREAAGQMSARASSNALACLVELATMHLEDRELQNAPSGARQDGAANAERETGQTDRRLSRRVRSITASLSQSRLAAQIFLYGNTGASELEQVVRLVASDVLVRTPDAYGVGQEEVNMLTELHSLDGLDDKDLPTMFSCSCPVEVVFPAREIARGLATQATKEVLPWLVKPLKNEADIRSENKEAALIGALRLADDGPECSLYPSQWASDTKASVAAQLAEQPVTEVSDIGRWWDWVINLCATEGLAEIRKRSADVRRAELETMSNGYQHCIDYDLSDAGPLAQACYFARERRDIYERARRRARALRGHLEPPRRSEEFEARLVRDRRALVSYLSRAIEDYLWYLVVDREWDELLEELLCEAEAAFDALDTTCCNDPAEGMVVEEVREMQGYLPKGSLYQRNALYTEGWGPPASEPDEWCPPAKRMYDTLTTQLRGPDGQGFSPEFIRELSGDILGRLCRGVSKGGALVQNHLRDDFLAELNQWAMLEVLERFVDPVAPGALDRHLRWVERRLQPTVGFDRTVAIIGSDEEGQEEERRDLERLSIGLFEESNTEAIRDQISNRITTNAVMYFCPGPDRHRLTFLHTWHGISLSMIPDYFTVGSNFALGTLVNRVEHWKKVQEAYDSGRSLPISDARPPFSCDAAAELAEKHQLPDKLARPT